MMQSVEYWKPIPQFAHYEISTMGRLRNTRTNKMIKPVLNGGYLKVVLSNDGKTRQVKIHRLVAEAFCPNSDPINKRFINHLNPKDTTDNRASMLEWVTPKENSQFILVSKFFGFGDEPSAEEQAIDHCPICEYGDIIDDGCELCSPPRRSSPRENYYRAAGMFS